MMRFYAMLRDSLKEAVDGWIFLVMLFLSGLLIVLIGSLSVRPASVEEAIPQLLQAEGTQFVSADRGQSSRAAIFMHNQSMSNVTVLKIGAAPWESEFRFTLTFTRSIMGPSGVDMGDVKDAKSVKDLKDGKDLKPEDMKPIPQQGGFFSDPIEDAARYWAAPAGTPAENWPKFTPALGEEFIAYQLNASSGIEVAKVEHKRVGVYEVTARAGTRLRWPHTPYLFFGATRIPVLLPLGGLVYWVENRIVSGLGAWVALLMGVIVTAGFIPNMLRKGSIDLLLTKPMSRPLILLYKYLGGLTFVAILTAVTAFGIWAVIGLRTGVWAPGLLFAVLPITYYFAILYACSTLMGVLTRNAIVCIVTTLLFWFVLYLIGSAHYWVSNIDRLDVEQIARQIEKAKAEEEKAKAEREKAKAKEAAKANDKEAALQPGADGKKESEPAPKEVKRVDIPEFKLPRWLVTTTSTLNSLTPRTGDLDTLTSRFIGEGLLSEAEQEQKRREAADVDWPEVIGISLAYIAIFLGLAALRFVTRSY